MSRTERAPRPPLGPRAEPDPRPELRSPRDVRALRATVGAAGLIATAAGIHSMIAGARSIPGDAGRRDPAVDSELRYYGAFYAAYGLAALRTAPRAEREPGLVGALAGAVFVGGLARASGWWATGRPHPLQRGLLAIELAAPPAVLALRARAAASG